MLALIKPSTPIGLPKTKMFMYGIEIANNIHCGLRSSCLALVIFVSNIFSGEVEKSPGHSFSNKFCVSNKRPTVSGERLALGIITLGFGYKHARFGCSHGGMR